MKSVKESLESLVMQLDAGKKIDWVRKTQFLSQEDGSFIRRIIRRDGTVELEENIPADRSITMAARAKTGFSQAQFARLLGISVRTLHDWEQGRRQPSGAAKTLLKIAFLRPEVLKEIATVG
ncbi:MAG: helix-turn-helix domain-containing protein [Desulfovibrio sp.]|jgi:DNA-binding transcriptional regulator YiaG|nr:helix-turn-helix domain-containing protein [Desulfovibrio sp.]